MSFDPSASEWTKVLGVDRKHFNMLFEKMMDGFAFHKIVLDQTGKPIDYIFLEVNNAFEQMTGLKREKVIGKRATEVLPGIEKDPANWIGVYGQVALMCRPAEFINWSEQLDKWFKVSAYCPEPSYFVTIFEDITERKKAEAKIAEQAFLVANVNDAIIAYDTEQKVSFWNKAAEKLYGFTSEEALGKRGLDLLRPAYTSMSREELLSKIAAVGHVEIESTRKSKDGRTLNIEAHVILLRNEVGKSVGFVSVDRDITERKKAEAALLYSNDRLKLISSITGDLLSAAEPKNLVQQICERVMAFLNCDVFFNFMMDERKNCLHLNAYAGVPPETAKTFEWLQFGDAVCGCAAKQGERIVCENIPDTNDQRAALVRSFGVKAYAANPIFSKGKVIGTLSFGTKKKPTFTEDELSLMKTVTAQVSVAMERKRAETELQTTYTRFYNSLSGLYGAVLLVSEEGRVEFANQSFCDYFGLKESPDQLRGLSADETIRKIMNAYLHPEREVKRIREIVATGKKVTAEEVAMSNGRTVLRDFIPLIDAAQAGISRLWYHTDITGRKKAEEELKRLNDELEERVQQRTAQVAAERQRLYNVLETLPSYVILLDRDHRVVFANKVFRETFGEDHGKRCYEYLFDLDFECEGCVTYKVYMENKPQQWYWTGPNGRDYDIYDFPFKEADGSTLILEMGIDVTEQKRAENLVRAAAQYSRSLIEASLDPLVTINAHGKITDVNKATEDATGCTRAELIGSDFSEYFTEPQKARLGYQKVFTDGFVVDYPLALKNKSGKTIEVLYNASVYRNEAGEIQGVFAAARDVTERNRVEGELKKHREHLEDLVKERTSQLWQAKNDWERTFDSVPDFIAVLDNQHTIIRANKAFAKQLGVTPDQAIGLKCHKCVHGTGVPPEFCPHAKTIMDGKEHVVEVHEPRLGGDFLVSTTPILDDRGKMVGSVHVARNITERKKAENMLRALNRHLRAVSNSNQALMRAENEAKYTQEVCDIIVNDCGYALAWVGLAENDKAKTVRPVASAGVDKTYTKNLKITWDVKSPLGRGPTGTAIRTGKPYLCKNMRTDPAFEPWRERAMQRGYTASCVLPLADVEGKIFGALNIYSKEFNPFTDEEFKLLSELASDFAYGVTMMRLRKEKEQSEATVLKQASLIDLSPDAIIMRKLNGEITFWSAGAEKLYGWNRKEALGQCTHELLKTKFPDSLDEIVRELATRGTWQGELLHEAKDGRTKVVQSYWLAQRDADGKIVELLESNVDITDRKQMQSKLEEYAAHLEELVEERTQQLKNAERLTAIGETAGMVGHDLRNPLQTVTGETFLAKDELKGIPDSEAKTNLAESIGIIAEQISYMDKIVSDLQDFVRPINPDKKHLDLKQLLTATLSQVSIPNNVEVQTKIDSRLPEILADGQLLKRVFFNLFTNAVQAMPEGGKLIVKAQIKKPEKENRELIITVSDTGVGIPENVKQKIFRPLFTTKSKGQGFGLAVCRRVVEAHGGTITFESQEGKGTKFIVSIPA